MVSSPEYAPFNRNFLHYPLARSTNAPLKTRKRVQLWSESYVIVPLHREAKGYSDLGRKAVVWLRVPCGLLVNRPDMERAPTRFDVDVLLRLTAMSVTDKGHIIHQNAFVLGSKAINHTSKKRRRKKPFHGHDTRHRDELAEAFKLAQQEEGYMQALETASGKPNRYAEKAAGKAAYSEASQRLRRSIHGNPILTFASKRQLLGALGRATNKTANYRSVEDSLLFLRSVEVAFANWYVDGEDKHDRRTIRFLDSVIYAGDGAVTISINPEFLSTVGSYFAKIPLPAPLSSEAALNLELWLRAFKPFDLEYKIKRDFRNFCERLGIAVTSPARAKDALDRAMDQANRHRKRHGDGEQFKVHGIADSDLIAFKRIYPVKRQDDDDSYLP